MARRSSLERFVRGVRLLRDDVPSFDEYPFSMPAVARLDELSLDAALTFFVGDNGAGKSTLIEAIAIAAGFNAEGGSRNFNFRMRPSESELHKFLRLVRGTKRPKDGYFLRAESFFNVATQVDELGTASHGERSLHEQSHGESFMQLLNERFRDRGLYLLDEPEAALSPQRQLAMLAIMHQLIAGGSQLIIATHSPILMAYPGAVIYRFGPGGIERVAYEDTEHYQLTRDFLDNRERYFGHLFGGKPDDAE